MEAGPVPSTPQLVGGYPLSLLPQHCLAYRPERRPPGPGRGQPPVRASSGVSLPHAARASLGPTLSAASCSPPGPGQQQQRGPRRAAGLSWSPLLSSPSPGYTAGHTGPSLGTNCRRRWAPQGRCWDHTCWQAGLAPVGRRAALMMPLMMCSWPTVILFH